MIYKSYIFNLGLRLLALLGALCTIAYGITIVQAYVWSGGIMIAIFFSYNLYRFVMRRFVEMDDFFEAVKYRDFSRWFSEGHGTSDLRKLHAGFNMVNSTIKSINNERQAQFLYLRKILEMVNVGIIAYNVEDGNVLWTNDPLLKILDFPSFKNISFVESRQPKVYDELFETYHVHGTSTVLPLRNGDMKVLISDTVFELEEASFKLIVLQNIEETLNRNESEAWKKLLSVMTHEIMNSIAPISSLAETLQGQVKASLNNPQENPMELEDLDAGIGSIKKRSEGLMKFAKTYRSLNKVTHVNKSKILARELFDNIEELLQPSVDSKKFTLDFRLEPPDLEIEVDAYLIEQVLINLVLNAIDATTAQEDPQIWVTVKTSGSDGFKIEVIDNGKGISTEIMDSIFIPFFSTKKTGSGIGLSLCKQIMMLHNGKIIVHSKEGEGTRFELVF